MSPVIEIQGVSKRFRLYHEKYQSLKERVIHAGRTPYEDFWALDDINLEIAEGETFGLIGHNGSGKSTLLKCIAGILRPTSGEIRTRGRLASMLELGTGFHPDLTGRENIYMNASILGFSERDIDQRFDDIVAFAELEEFIDQQVKHYSSGMYVRLGFSVAVHMDPEILLVDEVLSVGDEAFQAKSLGRMREFQRDGRTIVLVTHSIDLIPAVCDRAGVLEHGRLLTVAPPAQAVRALRQSLFDRGRAHEFQLPPEEALDAVSSSAAGGGSPVRISGIDVQRAHDSDDLAVSGEPVTLRLSFVAAERIDDIGVEITVSDRGGVELLSVDSRTLGSDIGPVSGATCIAVTLGALPLREGEYQVSAKLTGSGGSAVYDWWHDGLQLRVVSPRPDTGRISVPVEVVIEREPASEGVSK